MTKKKCLESFVGHFKKKTFFGPNKRWSTIAKYFEQRKCSKKLLAQQNIIQVKALLSFQIILQGFKIFCNSCKQILLKIT